VSVQNDIRFAIVDAFEREGITIPYPHRELLVRAAVSEQPIKPWPTDDDQAEAELLEKHRAAAAKEAERAAPKRKGRARRHDPQ
jgi:small-conductance mechanosensitive channel